MVTATHRFFLPTDRPYKVIQQVNRVLRTSLPGVHRRLKQLMQGWRATPSPRIPAYRTLHGAWTRVHPHFLTIAETEPHVVLWLKQHIRTGDVVFDVGAHVGFLSLVMARATGPTGRVFAFEPSEANLQYLNYHIDKNKLSHVEVVPKVVSEKHGEQVAFFLLHGGHSSSNSLVFERKQIPNLDADAAASRLEVKVDSVSIDTFCEENGVVPRVLKIDVEGAELLVLKGASKVIQTHRPKLIIGVHPWWLPPGQKSEDIAIFLQKRGYGLFDESGANVAVPMYGEYLAVPVD